VVVFTTLFSKCGFTTNYLYLKFLIKLKYFSFMPIADYQVFIALFLALATGIFAVRLGVALYK
jgi:photosystem I reaction center subunit XII